MDTVTYPQDEVVDCLTNEIVALRIAADQKPLSSDYYVAWTPALLVIDADGKEYHRVVGFLPPLEFRAELLLGMGKAYFNQGQYPGALDKFEEVMTKYPDSNATPEAIFWAGVSGYKNSSDPMPLRKAYDYLAEKYASSLWTQRAYPYRLIG